ncbi:TRAP transporter small permease [Jannaschia sp. W003]|uniref:TRAP transporter small permease n=1 Tax=Jannaschia sp. W003 TaxID=2867012 RepID=UPI0021A79862|nr:TRAP transporter small permease [Jannaschia sp. W003]UWQ21521.1 TRAP transporter small permease [Jannaschia sp. W003]
MLARVERLLLDLSVIAIVGLAVLITASVVMRATMGGAVPDTIVMVAELMVAAIVLPLAAATTARAHIVVEFLSKMFPRRVQDRLVVAGSLAGCVALMPLIYAGGREAWETLHSGTYFFGELGLPKWPGRVVFLLGMAFCWLRLAVMAVQDIRTIRAGGHLDAPHDAADLMGEP